MLVLVGRCTSLIEVGSLDKVIKSLVPGCTCTTTRGPVMVLQIRLLCFCFAASVLGWVPSPEPLSAPRPSSQCWGARGRRRSCPCARAEEAPGAWWLCVWLCPCGNREREIPGYVLYSWFALKWLLKLLSAARFSKISEEHLAGWSYCTETLLFPTSAVFDLPFLVPFCM